MNQFTDAKYMPAAEKRRVLRHWAAFLRTLADRYAEKDRCFAAFTEPLYTHLIQHCDFIAHYNRLGFFEHYFASGDTTRQFIRQFDRTANPEGVSVEYGYPWWLRDEYADINEAMREVATPLAAATAEAADAEQQRSDLAEAGRLAARHGVAFPIR